MKVHLYVQAHGAPARSLGSFEVGGDEQARRLAATHLEGLPEAVAIDIWWQSGELIRIERPHSPPGLRLPPGGVHEGPRLRS